MFHRPARQDCGRQFDSIEPDATTEVPVATESFGKHAKSEPRPKLDLNVVYSSLENVYQKMSMDVYTRILSQGTKVFETLKMPEDILHSTLNLRNFYFLGMFFALHHVNETIRKIVI